MSKIKGSSSVRLPVKVGPGQRGVTLIELVIVVAMVGILATLATVGYRRYLSSAKTGEATAMIGSIKSAQEAFKSETFRYLDVSLGDLDVPYPQGALSGVGGSKYAWAEGQPVTARKNFKTLGVSSTAPVLYGYSTVAGLASGALPNLPAPFEETPDWSDPGGPWYLVVAVGDLDGDGSFGAYAASSMTAQIAAVHPGE
jgi:type IV pilus assembly protein PilA